MQRLQIDLNPVYIIACVTVAIIVVFRFLDRLSTRLAAKKTKKILENHRNSNNG